MWIEELAEFKNEDEITTIENSVLREELEGKIANFSMRKKFFHSIIVSITHTIHRKDDSPGLTRNMNQALLMPIPT